MDSKKNNNDKIIDFEAQKSIVRESVRKLIVALPGCFINESSDEKIFAKIVDISDSGMGITSQRPLEPGQKITLITLDSDFELKVVWCREIKSEDKSNSTFFKIGLEAKKEVNLCNYFCNLQSNIAS